MLTSKEKGCKAAVKQSLGTVWEREDEEGAADRNRGALDRKVACNVLMCPSSSASLKSLRFKSGETAVAQEWG